MTSKKSDRASHFFAKTNSFCTDVSLIVAICTCFLFAPTAGSAKDKAENDLPIIHYAGIIPVQWDKEDAWNDLSMIKKSLSKDYSEAVKSSRRFVALNDDLVGSLWATPAGRKELASEYELQSFLALNMSSRGDTVVMTARMLSPTFDTWLQESEVVSRNWLAESSREQTVAKLGDLIHRMINRLPIDAHVTSVNGNFVTLSAGGEQSVSVGDEFDVISAKLQTLHPANGSWLTFTNSNAGRVKVVEAKGKSSIAKITSLTHENSIAVGQGIRIESISGRSRFARQEANQTFASAQTSDGNALVPAMKPDGSAAAQQAATTAPIQQTQAQTAKQPNEPKPVQQAAAPVSEQAKDSPPEPAKEGEGAAAMLAPKGSELEIYGGLKSWSIGGSGSASAALPLWLVNSVGATINRPISESVLINYGLDLGYGQTGKGSYFAYGVHGAGFYLIKAKIFDGADHVFGGLQANLQSISVGGESSGGYDLTSLSLVGGIGGDTDSSLIGTRLDWKARIRFALQESGRFGVAGSLNKVTGGRGLLLKFDGYIGERPKEGPQFGGGFEFGSGNYNLANSTTATYNVFSLLGLLRWTL